MANTQNPNIPINLNVFTFDLTPENRFYMCRSCKTSIFSFENLLSWETIVMFCKNPVNVRVEDGGALWDLNDVPMQKAACIQCNTELGTRIYRTDRRRLRHAVIREGNYMFYVGTLVLWDGIQVVDAHTMLPVGGD